MVFCIWSWESFVEANCVEYLGEKKEMPSRDSQGRICGFLDVDEAGKRKKFVTRFVILDKERNVLEWYTNDPSKCSEKLEPKETVNLFHITKVDILMRSKLEYCFVINTPYRPYYLKAENQQDLEEWADIVYDAGKITVPPDALHPPQASKTENSTETVKHSSHSEIETPDQSFQTRTEIVGGVVVTKKLTSDGHSVRKLEEPLSPGPVHSSDSNSALDSPNKFYFDQVKREDLKKNVIKSGWAVKQGHVRKNWKRRYFVLKSSGFAYYKTDQDKEPIRAIPINEILTAKEEGGEASKIRPNLLLVATTDKIYYMQADTHEEMKSWIKAFLSAIEQNRIDIQKNRVDSHKKKVQSSSPTNEAAGQSPSSSRRSKRASHLVTSQQWQSTSNLIPIVPVLHHLSVQVVDDDIGIGLGRSEAHDGLRKSPMSHQLRKRASAQSMCSSSQDSAIHSSCDSLDRGADGRGADFAKARPTHRRTESSFTILPTRVTGSSTSSIQTNATWRKSLDYELEDVAPRPESASALCLAHNDANNRRHSGDDVARAKQANRNSISSVKSYNSVMNNLDPKIDCRAAVKPSSIKKKKNTGILFSLNTMLNRKADKMNRPAPKKASKSKLAERSHSKHV